MTDEPILAAVALDGAVELVRHWAADPHAIHKRPPFRAHNFDGDSRYWVVGSSFVSVLHGWHGRQATAQTIADALNAAVETLTHPVDVVGV